MVRAVITAASGSFCVCCCWPCKGQTPVAGGGASHQASATPGLLRAVFQAPQGRSEAAAHSSALSGLETIFCVFPGVPLSHS